MTVFNGKVNFLEHQKLFLNGVEALEKEILDKSKLLSVEMRSKALDFIEQLEDTIGKHIGTCNKGELMAKKFIELAEENGIVRGIELRQVDDSKYNLKIEDCAFILDKSHPRLNTENRVCPFAMMISSIMKCALKTEEVMVEPSHFTPHSSETDINIM